MIQSAYSLEDQSEWPDLTPEDLVELPKRRDALLADAIDRYKQVRNIHKQITQPYDQWIDVAEKMQRDWRGAYEAAIEAARRFPQLTNYFRKAGEMALYAEMYPESLAAYKIAIAAYERSGDTLPLMDSYAKAGTAAEKAGETALAIDYYLRVGAYREQSADQLVAKADHCGAADAYKAAAGYFNGVFKLDSAQPEMQRKAVDLARKAMAETELCPDKKNKS